MVRIQCGGMKDKQEKGLQDRTNIQSNGNMRGEKPSKSMSRRKKQITGL